ncbi:hypothetical protein [Sinorhizobium medicae]|uniref:hypothetical protein n=1 Tax=Sinorhizobium medicae TaxID=110321 RepID=UPI0003FADA53|nr:hypothetical protein [Sinorhizobium medicae]
MTKQLVEVITSVERRRRWSRAEKERLVAATLESNDSVGDRALGGDPWYASEESRLAEE